METAERMTVGIVAERHRIDHPWPAERWTVVTALAGEPEVAPWTVLAEGEGWTRYYVDSAEVSLFRSEAENYKHNLDSHEPALYVILRRSPEPPGVALLAVTVDPGEIDTHSDSGDDLIEALPLPPTVAAWMQAFVERHYVPRPFHKRRRDRADPEALATHRPSQRDTHHD
ncbi:MAG TPA: DUF3305 domain-containing protein [Azospirillum sp.]|nr:DUF3305 domain-containing protein [Azospirillum sp.]